jgi:hypothetical protein
MKGRSMGNREGNGKKVGEGHGRRLSREGAQNGSHTLSPGQPVSGSVVWVKAPPCNSSYYCLDQAMVRGLVTHRGGGAVRYHHGYPGAGSVGDEDAVLQRKEFARREFSFGDA